jgi:hypothetical protein
VARHRSPRDHRAQPLPPVHLRGPVGRARQPAVPVLLLGHAAVATTVAAGGTVAVAQGDPVPTMHENLLATGSATTLERAEQRASVEPVSVEPETFDPAALVKAVRLEQARVEREERARAAAARCRAGFGRVKPWVAQAGGLLRCEFDIATAFGVARRSTPSDHPRGLAIDFRADRATGDALAQCALDNMQALSIKYVIWRQRINYGNGWEPMEDRGSPTANHMGHVHISFDARPRGAGLASC